MVDAKSKWMEIIPMSSTTTTATLRALRFLFSVHGLPEEMVSDNGPQFVSQEIKEFLTFNAFASAYLHHIIRHPMEKQKELYERLKTP